MKRSRKSLAIMIANNDKNIKSRLAGFHEAAEESLRNIFESVRTERPSFLETAEQAVDRIEKELADLSRLGGAGVRNILPAYHNCCKSLRSLIAVARRKIERHILFSEKAIQELEYLVGSLKYLFRCLRDALLTANPTLWKYIEETANSLNESAEKFAAEHEERLIAGLCLPEAAPVYLDLLEHLKKICLFFKETGNLIAHL